MSPTSGTSGQLPGHWLPPLQPTRRSLKETRHFLLLSNKDRNSRARSYNGNRLNLLNIAHWNAGNSRWETKRTELEALVLQKQPDILFVSEANLWGSLDSSQTDIQGYNLHYPTAMMSKHKYARIVLLAKNELDIKIEENLMNEDISAIWLSLAYAGNRRMKIGGIYREHRLLFQADPNPTKTDGAQLTRWNTILARWKTAARDPLCTVIGDLNLDFLNWQDPTPAHASMIARTKDEIETRGFTQIIRGHTRTWRQQRDSLLDHCWVTKPDRVINWENTPRGSSDHNYISVTMRTKDKVINCQETTKRLWKNFVPQLFKDKIGTLDWSEFYTCQNIDILNAIFVEKVGTILGEMAPMKSFQTRKSYSNWMDSDILEKMKARDNLRDTAKDTNSNEDWCAFKKARNNCTKILREKKTQFFKNNFEKHLQDKNIKATYGLAKNILGWSPASQPRMFLVHGAVLRKPIDLANALQNYYKDKIDKIVGALEKGGRDPLRYLKAALIRWRRGGGSNPESISSQTNN